MPEKSDLYPAAKWVLAAVLAYWAMLPYMVQLLIGVMGADVVSGLLAAFVRKELCCEYGLRGLVKKTLVLLLVGVTHLIGEPLNLGIDLANVVALGYIANELISITENCVLAGVPVPQQLSEALAKFKVKRKNGHGVK